VLKPRDCVLLKSSTRKGDLPYVAKIAALWENPDDGRYLLNCGSNIFRYDQMLIHHFIVLRRNDVFVTVVLPTRAHGTGSDTARQRGRGVRFTS